MKIRCQMSKRRRKSVALLAFPHVAFSNPAIEDETVIGYTYYYP